MFKVFFCQQIEIIGSFKADLPLYAKIYDPFCGSTVGTPILRHIDPMMSEGFSIPGVAQRVAHGSASGVIARKLQPST